MTQLHPVHPEVFVVSDRLESVIVTAAIASIAVIIFSSPNAFGLLGGLYALCC